MKYLKYFENHNNIDVKKIAQLIKSDCKPFIEELKRCGLGTRTINHHLIYRGFKEAERYEISPGIYQVTNHGQRSPLHTSVEVSDIFDDNFSKKFGVRPRKDGFYATKSKFVARDYGKPYLLFPIGEFRYFWNPNIDDFYTEIRDLDWYDGLFEYEDLSSNYDEMYGSNRNGVWTYMGSELSDDLEDSIDSAKLEFPELSKKSDSTVANLLYWKPEISEDEYEAEMNDKMYDDIESMVSGYIDSKDYEKVLNQEIMFICDEYYLIDSDLIDEVISLL